MNFIKLAIPEVVLLEPKTYSDERGFFFESFNHSNFEKIIEQKVSFVQDNQSCSHKGVLRGLHYQLNPKAQGKLVRIISGKVFDVAVDLKKITIIWQMGGCIIVRSKQKIIMDSYWFCSWVFISCRFIRDVV